LNNSTVGYNYYEEYFILNNNVPDSVVILPGASPNFGTFDGYIFEFAVRQYQYPCWDINDSWIIDVANGSAYHIAGTTGDLKNNTANYIDAGVYYKVSVTISNYASGSVDFYVSDVLAGNQIMHWS